MPNPVQEYLNRPMSVGTDLFWSALVGIGAGVVAMILPLNWIPIIGPQAPGIVGGILAAGYYIRARTNNPLNI